MDNNYIKDNLDVIFENFKNMIKVETVVGQVVQIGDATLVPFVDVTFGFGTGGFDGNEESTKPKKGAGGGGGAKMEPTAILVIKGDRVEMFSIKQGGNKSSAFEKLLNMVPGIIDKMKKDKYIYIKDDDVDEEDSIDDKSQAMEKDK